MVDRGYCRIEIHRAPPVDDNLAVKDIDNAPLGDQGIPAEISAGDGFAFLPQPIVHRRIHVDQGFACN